MTPTPSMVEAARLRRERLARIASQAFYKPETAQPPKPLARTIPPIIALPPQRRLDAISPTAIRVPWIDDSRITFERIKRTVADHFNMSLAEMESDRRHLGVVRARQIVMWLAKRLTPMSLPQIGRRLGDRDHTTVLYGIKRIGDLMATDDDLANLCGEFIRNLEEPR